MTNEVTKLDEVRNADSALNLLNNKQFTDAIEAVEKQYLDAFLTADEKDDLGRFRYAEAIKVVRLVKRQLNFVVQNAKLSRHELDLMKGDNKDFA